MIDRYLDSPDPAIRRWSTVAYCMATAVATLAWSGGGGLDAVSDGRLIEAVVLLLVALPVWWIVAGVGLRIVRRLGPRSTVEEAPTLRGGPTGS